MLLSQPSYDLTFVFPYQLESWTQPPFITQEHLKRIEAQRKVPRQQSYNDTNTTNAYVSSFHLLFARVLQEIWRPNTRQCSPMPLLIGLMQLFLMSSVSELDASTAVTYFNTRASKVLIIYNFLYDAFIKGTINIKFIIHFIVVFY